MSDFWAPEFTITHRPDGTILMRQLGDLPQTLPHLPAYLRHFAQATPDAVFLAERGADGAWVRLTYGAALERVRVIAANLLALGATPESGVMILSGNSIAHALVALGAQYAGCPSAAISTGYALLTRDHSRLVEIANLLQPAVIFAEGDEFQPALASLGRSPTPLVDLERATDCSAADLACATITGATIAKFLFTSGSTGMPKAVINTHGMLVANQAQVRDCFRFLEDEPPILLDWAPWNHTAGGNKVFYMALTNGGTLYIDNGRPTAEGFRATIANLTEVRPNWYFNLPIGLDLLASALDRDEVLARALFSRLRMLMYAGAGVAQHTWDRLLAAGERITGKPPLLATGLGSTETAPFALMCTTHHDTAGNVGLPAKGVTLKLVPQGDKLDARLKGPNITPGYYKDAKKTAEAFDAEGFYALGDALRPIDPSDLTKGFRFDGRTAENFKLATGTWVAVGALRASLVDALGGLVRDVVIAGEDRAYLSALLVPAQGGLSEDDIPVLRQRLAAHFAGASGSSNRICAAMVLPRAPDPAKGEVTEKGSLNQVILRRNFAAEIAAIYNGAPDDRDIMRMG